MTSETQTCRNGIASEAEKYKSELLSPDSGCEYDQLIEINLSELEPHVNGPFTPDLATPIGQLGDTAKKNGWPLEVRLWATMKKRACFSFLIV